MNSKLRIPLCWKAASGNATLTGSGVINWSGTIAGTLGVTGGNWNGTGAVTGLTTVSSGTFNIGSSGNLTANGNLTVSGNGALSASAGTSKVTGSVTYSSSADSTFAGEIAGSSKTVTVSGAGALTLSGANSYTGVTTINSGSLIVGAAAPSGSAGALGNATGATSLLVGNTSGSANAALLTGGAFTVARDMTVRSGNTGVVTIGGNTADASTYSGNINLGTSGANPSKDVTLVALSGGTVDFAGTLNENTSNTTNANITVGSGSFTGTVKLSNTSNGYTGSTTVAGGTLEVVKLAASGSNSSIGNSTGVAGNLVINGGTLKYTGTGDSTNRLFTVGNNDATLDASPTSTAVAFTGTGLLGASGLGHRTLTLASGSNASIANSLASVIVDPTSGSTAVSKTGTGTWVVSGNNTYSAATTVNAGAFYVNGTTSGQGDYSVPNTIAATTTLGGTGTIGLAASKTVTLVGNSASNRAVLSPGDLTTGVATFNVGSVSTNTVTLGNNSTLAIDISGATTDLLKVTGTLDTSSASNRLALNMSSPTLGKYKIADFTVGNSQGSNTAANGGFAAVTGLDSSYRLSVVTGANGEIDVIKKAIAGLTITAPAANARVMSGQNLAVTGNITNTTLTNGSALNIALSSVGASVVDTFATAGGATTVAAGGSVGYTATLHTTGQPLGANTYTVRQSDSLAATADVDASVSVNVLQDRVVTATTVNLGNVLVGRSINGIASGTRTSGLTSTGADGMNTRVTAGATSTVDGVTATNGGSVLFNGSNSGNWVLTGAFASAGVKTSHALTTTGEGLTGESVNSITIPLTGTTALNAASLTQRVNGSAGATATAGDTITLANASGSIRATALVGASNFADPRWSYSAAMSSSAAPGASTTGGTLAFNKSGLLNGYTYPASSVSHDTSNDVANFVTNDLGTQTWTLSSQLISGNAGTQSAPAGIGASYAGLVGISDKELGTSATILAGTNSNGGATTVTMSWRNRNANEKSPTGTTPPLPAGILGLGSDVVDLTGTDGDVFVLEMTYATTAVTDEALAAAAGALFVTSFDGTYWVNSVSLNHGVNTTNPTYMNYQGSWASSGAGLTLGAWGVDIANNVAWAVVDHNSEFAVTPEPASLLLLATGTMLMLKPRRRRR